MHHEGVSEPPGHDTMGLPLNLAMEFPREVYILHPEKRNEGSVELLSYQGGVIGRDFAEHAVPPNLGIFAPRFPVRDLTWLAARLKRRDVPIVSGPRRMRVAPYGQASWLIARAGRRLAGVLRSAGPSLAKPLSRPMTLGDRGRRRDRQAPGDAAGKM